MRYSPSFEIPVDRFVLHWNLTLLVLVGEGAVCMGFARPEGTVYAIQRQTVFKYHTNKTGDNISICLLYTSPSPRDS